MDANDHQHCPVHLNAQLSIIVSKVGNVAPGTVLAQEFSTNTVRLATVQKLRQNSVNAFEISLLRENWSRTECIFLKPAGNLP